MEAELRGALECIASQDPVTLKSGEAQIQTLTGQPGFYPALAVGPSTSSLFFPHLHIP